MAKSKELNKVWRQASLIASAVAQFIVDTDQKDLLDTGDVADIKSRLASAINLIISNGDYVTNPYLKLELLKKIDKADITQQLGNDTGKVVSQNLLNTELGKKASVADANSKLAKDQNGADIPDKPKFIENLRLSELFADKKRFDANGSFTLMFSEDRKFSLQLGNNGYLSLYNLTLDKSVMTWSPSGELVSGDIGFDRVKDLKSAAKRDVGNGTGQIPDMSFFPLSGIGTDNLIATFPNGLIIQVFKRTLANKAAAGEIETLSQSYPMAFPKGVAAVFCTKTSYAQTLVSCENATATGFSAVTVKVFESGGSTLSTANFLAIGWQ
ncbi:gp53-like domain-containing protein [Morganella morganii]